MRRPAILFTALALTAACSGTSGAVTSSTAGTAHFSGWTTYHDSADRSGVTRHGVTGALHEAWRAKLDGAVYGEPLIVHGTLIAATENDTVYGLSPSTGKQRWRTHLGTPQDQSQLPCGNVNPLGITGTPAYDPATGSVFVVAETEGGHHTLWALGASNGHHRWHRSMDVLPNRNRSAEQQRAALLVTAGRIIVAFGGLYGDCDNYVGYVTSTSTGGKGATTHYAVPTSREGGIWATPGPVVGPNGNVYVSVGNGAQVGGKWDGSDSVTELAPATMRAVASFAPSTWARDNADDADLGSSGPVPIAGRIVIAGKRGTAYLLKPSLGGIGGQVATATGCTAFGGAAHVGNVAIMPCTSGVRALVVGASSLRWRWTAEGIYGSAVVAGGQVYVADANSGELDVLSLSTGHVMSRIAVGSLEHFPSEVVDGNHVFVPTATGITAIRGS